MLLAAVQNAQFNYFVQGTGAGDVFFNGSYYLPETSLAVQLSSINVAAAPFGTGTVAGSELTFTVIPEPDTWAMLLSGTGILALWRSEKRRRAR